MIDAVHRDTVLSWASVEDDGNGSTYKEELVEFFPHGLADLFLHQWEHLHKVLWQRVALSDIYGRALVLWRLDASEKGDVREVRQEWMVG